VQLEAPPPGIGPRLLQPQGSGLVAATEWVYGWLFAGATLFAILGPAWGIVSTPFNEVHPNGEPVGLVAGFVLLAVGVASFSWRRPLYRVLRRRPWLVLIGVVFAAGALWLDGVVDSEYAAATYAPILVAAVVGGWRWALVCGVALAALYPLGIVVNGWTIDEIEKATAMDDVIGHPVGYVALAPLIALPMASLAGYVARINLVIGQPEGGEAPPPSEPRVTDALTPRELQVVQLLAEGLTNNQIAERLFVSPRTVQTHVANAMEKTGTRSRTELAVRACAEGVAVPGEGQAC
jgi:DNA-binding CsgD family transcriptional regulator